MATFNHVELLEAIRQALIDAGLAVKPDIANSVVGDVYFQVMPDDTSEAIVVAIIGGPLIRNTPVRNVSIAIQVRSEKQQNGFVKINSILELLHNQWLRISCPGRLFSNQETGGYFRQENGRHVHFANFDFTTI